MIAEDLTIEAAELVQFAQQIRVWQDRTSPRLSNEAMVRQFPGLGSAKTFAKLVDGDLASLLPENHLPRYRGVWEQIATMTGANGREEIYDDLTPTADARLAAAGLIPQQGRTRLMMIEGPTGSGKTTAMQCIALRYKGSSLMVEATEAWKNANCMLADMLVAAGAFKDAEDDKMPVSLGGKLALILSHLRSGRKIIQIDEGHHLSAAGLNIIKTILNQTDSVIIIAGIDTLWRKLAAKHWEEAKQLVFNRLFERVRLEPPTPEDVTLFLSRRCGDKLAAEWTRAVGKIAEGAKSYGYFSFLRRIAEKVNGEPSTTDAAALAKIVDDLITNLRTR